MDFSVYIVICFLGIFIGIVNITVYLLAQCSAVWTKWLLSLVQICCKAWKDCTKHLVLQGPARDPFVPGEVVLQEKSSSNQA